MATLNLRIKIIIPLIIVIFAFFLYFFKDEIFYYHWKFFALKKDYSKEYKAAFKKSSNSLSPSVSNFIIMPLEKARKEDLEKMIKATKQKCSSWADCSFNEIINYILTKEADDPPFDINQETPDFKLRIVQLYAQLKEADNATRQTFLPQGIAIAWYGNLLSLSEKNFWLKYFIEHPTSFPPFIGRIYLDIKNIKDLQEKALKLNIDIQKINEAERIICGTTIEIPSFSYLMNERKKLDLTFDYITRKEFCQIPRTQQDQELINQVIQKNYLRVITINDLQVIDTFGELIKYYLVNSDKIFR